MSRHVAETMLHQKVEGGINFGSDQGLLVAGDLTSLATAKTNVDSDNAKLHVAERTFGPRVKAALDRIDDCAGSSVTTSTSLAGADLISGTRIVGAAPVF